MRLLVVDQSRILQWLVRHEFPDGLDIASAQSLDEAERILEALPPDAAVVSLPPAELPWRAFQHRCAAHVPPIEAGTLDGEVRAVSGVAVVPVPEPVPVPELTVVPCVEGGTVEVVASAPVASSFDELHPPSTRSPVRTR